MSRLREEQWAAMSRSPGEHQGGGEPLSLSAVGPTSGARRAATVVLGMAGAGVLVGAMWAWLAPPVHGAVALNKAGRRLHVFLGNEADHFFVSAVIMAGLLVSVGVVSAVLVWQFRQRRGPGMVLALTLGGVCAAAAATAVGAGLARLRYGAVDIAAAPVSEENRVHYVVDAPAVFFGHSPLLVATTVLVPAGIAVLTYAVLAAVSAYDDLGVDSPAPGTVT